MLAAFATHARLDVVRRTTAIDEISRVVGARAVIDVLAVVENLFAVDQGRVVVEMQNVAVQLGPP